jgi:hypothetical protein
LRHCIANIRAQPSKANLLIVKSKVTDVAFYFVAYIRPICAIVWKLHATTEPRVADVNQTDEWATDIDE